MLSGMESGVSVIFEKAQHVFPPDKIELAGLHGFDRQLVPSAGDNRVQTQNFTGLRDADNQSLAIARGGRKLGAPLAENKNSARALSLGKNHRVFRKNRGMFYLVERFDRLRGEVAKETARAQIAVETAFNAVQAARPHWVSPLSPSQLLQLCLTTS